MSKIQILRSLVTERLAAAAEEIFVLFERTLTEYEGEIDRQRKLLHVLTPGKRTDQLPPQPSVCEEEVVCEQQERSPSLDQEESQPPQIKEEQEELWSSQEGEQLQGLEEAEVKWTSTPVPVKREHDEEEPQCSWFNQSQPEDSREAQPLPRPSSGHMDTQPDGDHWASPSHLRPRDDSRLPHYRDEALERSTEAERNTGELVTCVDGRENTSSLDLVKRGRGHTLAHPFGCVVCGKAFKRKTHLQIHMRTHTGERPFHCPACDKSFCESGNLNRHLRTHSNEKPFRCSVCGKGFRLAATLKTHMRTHSSEVPFSCPMCGKGFRHNASVRKHMKTHLLG